MLYFLSFSVSEHRAYIFGFNGKEKDDEVSGSGNSYDYGFRIYNPRIGKFLSVDPLSPDYAFLTPYQYASNSPVVNIDIDGLEGYSANGGGWVTNPPISCNGCAPITIQKYNRIKEWYDSGGGSPSAEAPEAGFLYIFDPKSFGLTGQGFAYQIKGKPELKVSIAADFDGGSTKNITNAEDVDRGIDDLIEKLESYPDAQITLTANAGTDGKTEGVKYGDSDEIYEESTSVDKGSGTVGDLMEGRGNTIRDKLIEKGITAERISVKKGVRGDSVKDRRVDVDVNISD